MLFKNLKNPKTKHMKYKKQKTQKTNLSDFYVKYCTGIYKFCPNYEQQKMKDNASKLKSYIHVYNYDSVCCKNSCSVYEAFSRTTNILYKAPHPDELDKDK